MKAFLEKVLPNVLFQFACYLNFLKKTRTEGYRHPHVQAGDTATPIREISRKYGLARLYVEYGAGDSTFAAAGLFDTVVSVENDLYFLKQISREMRGRRCRFIPVASGTGLTYELGYPVFQEPTRERVEKWRVYPRAPWKQVEKMGEEPELIFIDGRFRVACALECLLRLKDDSRTLLLFDDYYDREYYHAIEDFIEIMERAGQGLLFRKGNPFDSTRCRKTLESYYTDCR